MTRTRTALCFALGLLLLAAALAGETPASLDRALDLGAALDVFHGVAIAPDGRQVAWVESLAEKGRRAADRTGIWVAPLDGAGAAGAAGTPRRITALAGPAAAAGAVEEAPAWSPDGRRLAFLSDAGEEGQTQVWVVDTGGNGPARPRRLTRLAGHLADPKWSPDGRSIAFLYIEGKKGKAGPLEPTARDAGVVGETPEVQRIALADVRTGAVRLVSPADLFVYEHDLSPDGSTFAATAAAPPGDANWWVAQVWAIPADGSAARPLYKPRLQVTQPRWSPDGRAIAFVEGLMSDAGVNGGDVHVLPAAGGGAKDVTPGMAASASALFWTAPDRILFTENVDGEVGIAAVGLADGRIETLWRGPEVLAAEVTPAISLAGDGRTSAAIRHSFGRAPEVWAGPIGGWKQVTRANAGLAPAWGEARSLHWTSDGASVQGWLLAPPQVEAGKRHPLVVVVHGGPSSSHRPGWPSIAGALASQGFYVLLPNPRGSFGQGAKFAEGNVKDFGYGDLRDILAGIDAAAQAAPVDPERAGIYGWSYGGYMVMWAVTQTNRFKAAVAGAGIANWQSYYGQNRIDTWMIPFFGASVYDDPEVYARSSPINFIKNVRTPTLVLQGERDSEVPAPQAYEFWKALKALGVETRLVIYPDQGHRLLPESERDRSHRLVDWMASHLH